MEMYCGNCQLGHLILLAGVGGQGGYSQERNSYEGRQRVKSHMPEELKGLISWEKKLVFYLEGKEHVVILAIYKEYAICSIENGLGGVKQKTGDNSEPDLPGSEVKPMSSALADGFLTTGPPAKSLYIFFFSKSLFYVSTYCLS